MMSGSSRRCIGGCLRSQESRQPFHKARQCLRRYINSSPSTHPEKARPRTIFSGIQPTGIPHLGNYLGALENWVKLQDESPPNDELIFSIVGLHAITMPQDPKSLRIERRDMLATLLAIGLDPNRCTIFHQDQVQEHVELAWYLNCLTSIGKLSRMTTWKSKLAISKGSASVDESHLSLGLLAYPVLQAADIILYRATHVPVGEDQVQHLELSRDIADLFNRTYKEGLFPLPQHIITPTKRVLSLRDPSQKMSKSSPDVGSRILLTDTPKEIENKIKRAVTDSNTSLGYEPTSRPGVSNLLLILSALRKGDSTPESLAEELNELGGSGSTLKKAVSDAVIGAVTPLRERIERLKADPGYLVQVEKMGREKAKERAQPTMERVRALVGLTS